MEKIDKKNILYNKKLILDTAKFEFPLLGRGVGVRPKIIYGNYKQ